MLVPNKPVKWWINWWLWIYENNVCELRCEPAPSCFHTHIFIRSSHKWFPNIHSQYLSHWSQTMVSYTEIKVTITFQSILNGITWKYCSVAFTCIVTGYSTDQEKGPRTRIPNSSLAGSLTRVLASPQGKQRSNDYACVNIGCRTDQCCLTGIIRNHASQRIKLFWSYSSFNFLYFCFFSLMYRNTSFFLHVMYNRSCFLCFPWNFWAGNRRAAGENTYHLRMPYVSLLWCCYQGRITLYFSILF